MPFWKRCDTCNLDYHFIGKMETFSQDSKYIMEKVGIDDPKIVIEEKGHAKVHSRYDLSASSCFAHFIFYILCMPKCAFSVLSHFFCQEESCY